MMNSILLILLTTSLFSVVFVNTALARLFKAKRPSIRLSFLVIIFAVAAGIAVQQYYMNNSIIVLASIFVTYSVLLLLFIGMGLLETLISSIASIALIGLILFGGGMALDKYQKTHLVDEMLSYIKDNQSFISLSSASASASLEEKQALLTKEESSDFTNNNEEMLGYSEETLLPNGASPKKEGLKDKIYHVIKLRNAHTLKGDSVRILKKDGDVLKGTLVEVKQQRIVLGIYIPNAKGKIIAPIPFSAINKLEVYR